VELEDQSTAPSTVWALGDYHRFAKQMVWGVGPELVEACGIESGQSVLDVEYHYEYLLVVARRS
jgi:hypothetical protein